MSKATTSFVETMIMHFPPFRWEEAEERAWAATLTKELRGFADETINRARSEMVRTRKDRRTPLVSECINACLDAKRWLDAEQHKGTLLAAPDDPNSKYGEWTADRFKLATDLCSSGMGKEAARDGWIGAMHAFARKHSRLPNGAEIADCKRKAREFDAAYAQCVRDAGGCDPQRIVMAGFLEQMGAEMLKRRNDLADRILRGVA